jgi:hypothetical protein
MVEEIAGGRPMEAALNDVGSRSSPELTVAARSEDRDGGEAVNAVLWYPVGILLGVLALASMLLFCIPGRWIG